MTAAYPPVGTRVRWTNRGVEREGAVVSLHRDDAKSPLLAFHFREVFGWPGDRRPRYKDAAAVVDVDTVDGKPRTGARRYYHPRPQWLEVVETGEVPG